jgi:hypothetical protein
MIGRGHINIAKVAGRFTTTRARIRAAFEQAMDGGQQS